MRSWISIRFQDSPTRPEENRVGPPPRYPRCLDQTHSIVYCLTSYDKYDPSLNVHLTPHSVIDTIDSGVNRGTPVTVPVLYSGAHRRSRRPTLAQQAQRQLMTFIEERGLEPGSPLPSEANLSVSLGISRASLREGMRSLQAIGVVESRQGVGTFVGQVSLEPLEDVVVFSIRSGEVDESLRAISDLLEVREVLETHLIQHLVDQLSASDFAELDDVIDGMVAKADRDEPFPAEDQAFHDRLYAKADNQLVRTLVSTFWKVSDRVEDQLPPLGMSLHSIADLHRDLVEALRSGDPAETAAAMNRHFVGIRTRVSESVARGS